MHGCYLYSLPTYNGATGTHHWLGWSTEQQQDAPGHTALDRRSPCGGSILCNILHRAFRAFRGLSAEGFRRRIARWLASGIYFPILKLPQLSSSALPRYILPFLTLRTGHVFIETPTLHAKKPLWGRLLFPIRSHCRDEVRIRFGLWPWFSNINLTQAHFFAEHAPFISQIFIGQESGKQ